MVKNLTDDHRRMLLYVADAVNTLRSGWEHHPKLYYVEAFRHLQVAIGSDLFHHLQFCGNENCRRAFVPLHKEQLTCCSKPNIKLVQNDSRKTHLPKRVSKPRPKH
jgi:hypothetical protein